MTSTHVLVPVSLTWEMLSAMADKAREVGSGDFVALWSASVSAAPPPPLAADDITYAGAEVLPDVPPTKDSVEVTSVPNWLIAFLRGEDHWPGHPEVGFGDTHPTERGAFFWRKYLTPTPLSPSPREKALEEALRPFAEAARHMSPRYDPIFSTCGSDGSVRITFEHFSAARALLESG